MDPHPTITIDHYSSSSASSTSTSLHTKSDRNEAFHRQTLQQHKSPSSKSSSQLVGSSIYTTGTLPKQHEQHSFITTGKQSKVKPPVRQRSVSPPTSSQLLTATDPQSARRNRRRSVCAVIIAPPSASTEDEDHSESSSHSDTTTIRASTITEGSMPDSSNNRRTMEHAPHHGKHHGHRKNSSTPKQSPNASPRGSRSNLSALSSSLMDKIHQANLCIRRKSSPAISIVPDQLNTIQISSLRGSLALADALSSTSNSHAEISSTGKQRTSSKQSGYSGGSPVYMEGNSGVIELRRKDHLNYLDNSRRLSSSPSLEKGKKKFHFLFQLIYNFILAYANEDTNTCKAMVFFNIQHFIIILC